MAPSVKKYEKMRKRKCVRRIGLIQWFVPTL
jgi:hypothetical protein